VKSDEFPAASLFPLAFRCDFVYNSTIALKKGRYTCMAKYMTHVSQAWGMPVEKLAGLSVAMPYLEYDAAARWVVTNAREHDNGRISETA